MSFRGPPRNLRCFKGQARFLGRPRNDRCLTLRAEAGVGTPAPCFLSTWPCWPRHLVVLQLAKCFFPVLGGPNFGRRIHSFFPSGLWISSVIGVILACVAEQNSGTFSPRGTAAQEQSVAGGSAERQQLSESTWPCWPCWPLLLVVRAVGERGGQLGREAPAGSPVLVTLSSSLTRHLPESELSAGCIVANGVAQFRPENSGKKNRTLFDRLRAGGCGGFSRIGRRPVPFRVTWRRAARSPRRPSRPHLRESRKRACSGSRE